MIRVAPASAQSASRWASISQPRAANVEASDLLAIGLHRILDLPPYSRGLSASPMSDATPIVFVVDEDMSVRESLGLLIRCGGWRPEMYASAAAFLARPRVDVPNCLILDASPPDLNGLDVQTRVAARQMEMPIIFITGDGDVPMAVQAMKAGAVEFLTMPFSDDVLLDALRHAIDRSRTALCQKAEMRALRARYASLSRREREVMALVVC